MSRPPAPQKNSISRSRAFGKDSKKTPPPPVCTIPLPAANPKSSGVPRTITAKSELRKFAATTQAPARLRQKRAGYPRRSGTLMSWLFLIIIAAMVLTLFIYLPLILPLLNP